MDKGRYASASFIDLKKAFDTVDHQIPLNKLKVYGLSGKEIAWFESYLGNCKQCCSVYGQNSDLPNIKLGVPQGFCLGPLLVLIYINDLPLTLNASVASMYADDTSISLSSNSISTINNVVNKGLESLKTWLEENKLFLNVAKTHCILIGSRSKIRALNQSNTTMPSIYIGDDKVSSITSIKYLGVHVVQYLNWEGHLLTIINKVSRGIGMLRLAKRYLPLETVQMMYRSLIEPY